ncbi:MAG: hypothetical protein P8172_12705 [Gammaproteobacteria bacterium]
MRAKTELVSTVARATPRRGRATPAGIGCGGLFIGVVLATSDTVIRSAIR